MENCRAYLAQVIDDHDPGNPLSHLPLSTCSTSTVPQMVLLSVLAWMCSVNAGSQTALPLFKLAFDDGSVWIRRSVRRELYGEGRGAVGERGLSLQRHDLRQVVCEELARPPARPGHGTSELMSPSVVLDVLCHWFVGVFSP